MVRRRQTKQPVDQSTSEDPPIHAAAAPTTTKDDDAMSGVSSWSARSQWLFFAAASGACAAFNGVFAKLYVAAHCHVHARHAFCLLMMEVSNRTTTELTTTLSNAVANFLGLSSMETVVEVVVRAVSHASLWNCEIEVTNHISSTQVFFILNLTFNGVVRPPLPFL